MHSSYTHHNYVNARRRHIADATMNAPLNHWLSLSGLPASDVLPSGSQRVLDSVVVDHIFQSLVNTQTTQYHRADS